MKTFHAGWNIGVLGAGLFALAAAAQGMAAPESRRFTGVAVRREIPPGAPAASDVCMRGLHPRTRGPNQPHDTLEAIRGFHVTRLEWIYRLSPDFIERVRELGCTVQGAAANGCWAPEHIDDPAKATFFVNGRGLLDTPGAPRFEDLSILDLDGEPVIAPWMRTWQPRALWGCINNPEMRAGHLRYMMNLVDLGVDSIQQDAAEMNSIATRWGACFCEHCLAGFREFLGGRTDADWRAARGIGDLEAFDYGARIKAQGAPSGQSLRSWASPEPELVRLFEEFQAEASAKFHRWWRGELNRHAGRRIPVSANNYHGWDAPHYREFDWGIREMPASVARPESLYEMMREAADIGKVQSWTMPLGYDPVETPEWRRLIRQTLATTYATGGHMQAPWDTYLPAPSAPRFFGEPAGYADLYAFVRGCAGFLDGYEDAAAVGRHIRDDRWPGLKPVTVLDADARIYAFVRAVPGEPDRPVVIHLVDSSARPEPFAISFDPSAAFGDRAVRIRLARPRPYDSEAHDRAWGTRDYAPLVEWLDLGSGARTTVSLPALDPWGILVIEPAEPVDGVWAPAVLNDGRRYAGETALVLSSATGGAEIRYTLDGSDPTPESELYTGPLDVTRPVTLKARAYLDGAVSELTAVPIRPVASLVNLVRNGRFEEGKSEWEIALTNAPAGALEFGIDDSGALGGTRCARLRVAHPTGRDYHLRLRQEFESPLGSSYRLSFTARADRPVVVRVGLQESVPPHRVLNIRFLEIGTEPRTHVMYAGNVHGDLVCGLHFDFGAVEAGATVWLGDVALSPD